MCVYIFGSFEFKILGQALLLWFIVCFFTFEILLFIIIFIHKHYYIYINPVNIFLLKANTRNTRKRYEICSKLPIKIPERRQWRLNNLFAENKRGKCGVEWSSFSIGKPTFISLKSLLRLVGFHVNVSVANKYMLKVNNRNTQKVVNYVHS